MSRDGVRPVTIRLAGALVIVVVWAFYARVVGLTPFHDDAPVMFEINSRTLLSVFAPGGSHYRPASYIWWLLIRDIFGWYDAPVLYWLNLALHTLNTSLVMALVRVLPRRSPRGIMSTTVLAGALFGLYPLSYQVLTWASAMVHTTLTAYTLAAALCMAHARLARDLASRRRFCLAAMVCVGLALTSHQYGIVAPLLVALVDVFLHRRPSKRALALVAAAAGYALWLGRATGAGSGATIGDLPRSAHLLAQAIAYPFAQLLSTAGLREPVVGTWTAVTAAAALVIAMTALAAQRMPALIAFAALWTGVSGGLLIAALPADYIAIGPRLFYISAVGIAILWSAIIDAVQRARIAGIAAALAICVGSMLFSNARLTQLLSMSTHMRAIGDAMRALEPNGRIVILNQPTWMTLNAGALGLPMGNASMLLMAENYSPPWAHYWSQTGLIRDVQLVRRDDLRWLEAPAGPVTAFVVGDVLNRDARRALLQPPVALFDFVYTPDGIALRTPGALSRDAVDGTAQAIFDLDPGTARLASASASQCADAVTLNLRWHGVRDATAPLSVFVHAYAIDRQGGADGGAVRLVAANADLIDNLLPLNALAADWVVDETRYLTLPAADVLAGEVRIGVVTTTDGRRKRAFKQDGSEWSANEVRIPVVQRHNCK